MGIVNGGSKKGHTGRNEYSKSQSDRVWTPDRDSRILKFFVQGLVEFDEH